MTLPASGPLSLNNIANEFGGYIYPSNFSFAGRNINFSNYLNNGGYIPNDGTIHSSGQISVSMFYDKCDYSTTTKGLWFGGSNNSSTYYSIRTTVDENGTVSSDSTLTNAARTQAGAVYYGGGLALLWGGFAAPSTNYSTLLTYITGLGGLGTDSSMAGTGRRGSKGLTYGFAKGLLYGGYNFGVANLTGMSGSFFGSNTVSTSGVIGTDTFIVGTYMQQGFYEPAALSYGGSNDKGIFAYGSNGFNQADTFQLVSNTGVIGSETAIAGVLGSGNVSGVGYGGDKGLIFRGGVVILRNTLSNTGVITCENNVVPSGEEFKNGFVYGGSKGIMGYGRQVSGGGIINTVQYITNVGVAGAVTATASTARSPGALTAYGA